MKNFLTLLVIAFSLTVNSQNNLTIKGKFLNFKEFESLNYYHITCNVYNPLSSFSKHSFVMFDKNGEFEFNFHIDYPTILDFRSQHRKYYFAVKPGDVLDFTINLSESDNSFLRENFSSSNWEVDSILFELNKTYNRNNIKSINSQKIEDLLNGHGKEQSYFILNYLAYLNAETVSIKNEKLRFIEYYKIISFDSVVYNYNRELDDLITKQHTDFIINQKKPDDSIVLIDKQFDTFTNLIEYIRAKHKGKVTFIDVWFTACGGCVFDLKKKKEFGMQKFFDNHNVQCVFIDLKSPEIAFTYYINKLEMKGEHYRFDNKISIEENKKYSIIGFPHYFLIDKNGEFVNMRSMRPWVKIDGKYKLNYELLNTIDSLTSN